jgi:flagellar hook-length control protein FliK
VRRIEQPSSAKPLTETAPASELQPLLRAAAAPAAPARVERPVRLHELADAVKTTIRVAAGEGRTTARISLQPEELGRVEIHLRYDGAGVSASVATDSSAAAEVLTAASGELRRSLEAQGFTVLGLDVHQGGLDLGTTPDRDRLGTPGGAPHGRGNEAADEPEETTTTIEATTLPLGGSQVDVLA